MRLPDLALELVQSFYVFRIRYILAPIWNLGSVSVTNGSGSGSGSFRQWPSRCSQKICFSLSFYAYSFLKVHLHHSSKIKTHKEVTKVSRFFFIFCLLMEGSGSVGINFGSGFRRPKNIRILRIRNIGLLQKQAESLYLVFSLTRHPKN
jgi:hypothetical protein